MSRSYDMDLCGCESDGGYCEVEVKAMYLGALPYEAYSFDEDEYGRVRTKACAPDLTAALSRSGVAAVRMRRKGHTVAVLLQPTRGTQTYDYKQDGGPLR